MCTYYMFYQLLLQRYCVILTQRAKILNIPSNLSMKGEELLVIHCNVVIIKARVPTHHEQAPCYDEKSN